MDGYAVIEAEPMAAGNSLANSVDAEASTKVIRELAIMTAAQRKYTNFYRTFEDRFRGPRESVIPRLAVYLPFVEPLKTLYEPPDALDLGCGRGEWLELLQQNGFQAKGVDLDEGMLAACRELNLDVVQADALDYLKVLATDSLSVVSAFHVVEHISFDVLCQLVDEAYRVLKPGGLLILETPNSENLVVGTSSFYLDPTHQRPLPAQLLSFVAEYMGFERVKALYLQEPSGLATAEQTTLSNILNGVSPDYAVIAQKKAAKAVSALFDEPFERAYGLRLIALAERYDQQVGGHAQWLQNEWNTAKQRIEELSKSTGQLEAGLAAELQKAENLAAALSASNERNTQLEAHAQWLQNGWDDARERNTELEAHAQWLQSGWDGARERNIQLEAHAQWLQSGWDDARERNTQLEAHAQWLQNELDAAHAKVHELDQSCHHWWTLADRLSREQQSIYASTFWRITWPLRKIMQIAKWLLMLPVRVIKWLIRLPKRLIKPLIRGVMRRSLNNPGIRNRARRRLAKYPQLKQHLRLFAMRSGLIAENITTASQASESDAGLQTTVMTECSPNVQEQPITRLSPRAARIHAELKNSIDERQS